MTTSTRGALLTLSAVSATGLLLLSACTNRSAAPSHVSPAASHALTTAHTATDVRSIRRMLTTDEARDYVGDVACAGCHPAICKAQGRSRHARTLARVTIESQGANFRQGNRVEDDQLGYVYQPEVRDGKCVIAGKAPSGGGFLTADYVMGSGKNAHTYLSRAEPNMWVDLRVSYYTGAARWDFTPMQKPGDRAFVRAAGIEQRGDALESCLLCHSTTVVAAPDGPDISKSHFGIGCERCHGPARAHVESARIPGGQTARLEHMEDLSKATPARINEVCGDCHRTQANAPPGDPHTENGLARFEGAALVRSRCYQVSGRLSCITCHDPHGDAESDSARNDARCISCHDAAHAGSTGRARTVCKVNRKEGCVRCHMPAQAIKTIPHAAYHHHWIRVWQETVGGRASARP